ncbi:hypothetical protein D0B54_00115 [Solimonas sp. K1W22B-7]|uniref:phosphatidylinositol-specific phospholipase C/glycerophosphodiester phosphodiesterase family protein n=1 Tax=Solimonas sp. K1W22B-7 TaxID=2303331 RepID=UPI000E332BB5|nr:phosphatidylinositol-specific phospholipase C/glycerophosphodiester phosphodiesterase family protein [Solimonas sp. K1W22B-7]AXQ27189.1 hypothetical protein D0B54_00115 [Solimonas sp. K1W22B-7]
MLKPLLATALLTLLAACSSSAPPDSDVPGASAGVDQAMRQHAHAHNDYLHETPLIDALQRGFGSVEADVYRTLGGDLAVAHSLAEIRPGRTLRALYLEPLATRASSGDLVAQGQRLQLLVDLKSAGPATWQILESQLAEHGELFTRYDASGMHPGAVDVVVSGNRPRADMEAAAVRRSAYDGRLSDLDDPAPAAFMPLISADWAGEFGWDGSGEFPQAQRLKLQDAVRRTHAAGRKLRLYGTPDAPGEARDRLWCTLLAEGVDWLNTDDLDGLREFFQRAPCD